MKDFAPSPLRQKARTRARAETSTEEIRVQTAISTAATRARTAISTAATQVQTAISIAATRVPTAIPTAAMTIDLTTTGGRASHITTTAARVSRVRLPNPNRRAVLRKKKSIITKHPTKSYGNCRRIEREARQRACFPLDGFIDRKGRGFLQEGAWLPFLTKERNVSVAEMVQDLQMCWLEPGPT